VRDFGPGFILNSTAKSQKLLVRPLYEGTFDGQNSIREKDANFISYFSEKNGAKVIDIDLAFEWGNLLTNGCGLCISNNAVVHRNAMRKFKESNREYSAHHYEVLSKSIEAHFKQIAKTWFGCDLVVLEPLVDAGTKHVDMTMFFASPDHLVFGMYTPEEDPMNHVLI
jgi:agmatine/peptidylarginine deiminase